MVGRLWRKKGSSARALDSWERERAADGEVDAAVGERERGGEGAMVFERNWMLPAGGKRVGVVEDEAAAEMAVEGGEEEG